MYIQPLNPNRVVTILLACLLAQVTIPAMSLSTDQQQSIEVEADAAELDDARKVSIYTGNVVVVQGSIRMTGEKMTVYHTEDSQLDRLIMEGHPATYRQLPDNVEVYDEAEGMVIEYYELRNLVVLIENARVKQEGGQYSAKRIEYNTLNSRVRAWSRPEQQSPDTGASLSGETERVKIILKPKQPVAEPPAADAD